MKRLFFAVVRILLLLGMAVIGWVNVRLYDPPVMPPNFDAVPPKAVLHLSWLRTALEDGAGERMQQYFPEGYFFCHELYGLAWVELGLRSGDHREEAIREARWALKQVESEKGREVFPESLSPGHGMFYAGWRNHLHAGVALLSRDSADIESLQNRCDQLVVALKNSPAWPWLASYADRVWPCDAPPGIHAMRVCDSLTGEDRYAGFVESWLEAVKEKLDPEYGMITHTADPKSGDPIGTPRGTSQTVILRFLRDIDVGFAGDQYRRFQKHFHDTLINVPAIREYPRGVDGGGDVDSGPLVFGISASATVVGMGTAQIFGDHEFAGAISQFGEVFRSPFDADTHRFLGGVLPVGDAFVVHATTARPWLTIEPRPVLDRSDVSDLWRSGLHLISTAIIFIMLMLFWFCRIMCGRVHPDSHVT